MVTVSDGAITLRDDGDPNVRRAGIWGLKWQNGSYAQVGDMLDTDDDREEIRRALLPGWPLPPAGSQARLDNSAFPGDPARMGIDFTEVHFAAPGEETPAWFVPGTRSTWLIYVHGKGADRREALRMLPATAALGFPALVITSSTMRSPRPAAAATGMAPANGPTWKRLCATPSLTGRRT